VNFEVGFSQQLLQQRLTLNATLFYIDWRDVQLSTFEQVPSSGSYVTYFINANRATSQGAELELTWQLNPQLSLMSSYAYSDANLAEDAPHYNGPVGFGDNGYQGDKLPGAPTTQAYLALMFEQAMGALTFNAAINGHYVSAVTTQLNDEHLDFTKLAGYSLFRASIGLHQDSWRASLYINNINNKRAISGMRGDGHYGPQGTFNLLHRPRTVGIDLRYQL
jgi:outer membrane receptor protein involved in Fe transport